jgi:hypothetical protein
LNNQPFQFPLPALQLVGGTSINATALEHRADLQSFVITFGN